MVCLKFSKINTRGLNFQERAEKRIPGFTQLLSKRPDMFSLGVWPCYYREAHGVQVWDLDDNCYIDMSIGGIGANILGYADPDVNGAVMEAIASGSSSSLNSYEEVELAELLCELHPWAHKARFARTGGEAMAIAVRIARAHTGRDVVAFCGYHGWHDWYLAANLASEDSLSGHLLPGLSARGIPKGLTGTAFPFRYNCIGELKEIVGKNKDRIAAVVLEPVRNQQPEGSFLMDVRDIAGEIGAVLIVDEISSGFRMNTGGAHLLYNFIPDVAVFSKALGNGFPVAAIIGKDQVMNAVQETFISSTMWTERVGSVAAIATIRKHQKMNVGDHLVEIGKLIQKGWIYHADKHGLAIQVGGIPPLSHFSFQHGMAQIIKAVFVEQMLERGFLASTLFYAMFAHQKEHVDRYLKAVDDSFACIKAALDTGKLESVLLGKPATMGFKRLT